MDQIKQLEEMRDAALARLGYNSDYKLLTTLNELIIDLHSLKGRDPEAGNGDDSPLIQSRSEVAGNVTDFSEEAPTLLPEDEEKLSESLDEAFEKLATHTNGSGLSLVEVPEDLEDSPTVAFS